MNDMNFGPVGRDYNPWSPEGLGRPGVIPLRPLEMGEIFSGALSTLRRYPAQVFGVAAVFAILTGMVSYLTHQPPPEQLPPDASREEVRQFFSELISQVGLSLTASVFQALASAILAGILTTIVGRAVLGRPVGLGEAVAEVGPRLPALIVLSLLTSLIVAVGFLLCVAPGIWLMVLFSLSTSALVMERLSIGRALGRSKDLISGHWWRTFGILLVTLLMAFLVALVFVIPGEISQNPVYTALGASITMLVVAPFALVVVVLLYLDLRMRKENLHYELARASGTLPPAAGPA